MTLLNKSHKLYYFPAACSLAAHAYMIKVGMAYKVEQVALHEADGVHKLASDLNPRGAVPILLLPDGQLLTQNIAILPYLAKHNKDEVAYPTDENKQMRVREAMGFCADMHPSVAMFWISGGKDYHDPSHKKLAMLEEYLKSEHACAFIKGNELTVAGFYAAVILSWAAQVCDKLEATFPNCWNLYKTAFSQSYFKQAEKEEGLENRFP